MYPSIEVIGVFNSWLTFATKSCLSLSSCFWKVTSVIVINIPDTIFSLINGVPLNIIVLFLLVLITISSCVLPFFFLTFLINEVTFFCLIILVAFSPIIFSASMCRYSLAMSLIERTFILLSSEIIPSCILESNSSRSSFSC